MPERLGRTDFLGIPRSRNHVEVCLSDQQGGRARRHALDDTVGLAILAFVLALTCTPVRFIVFAVEKCDSSWGAFLENATIEFFEGSRAGESPENEIFRQNGSGYFEFDGMRNSLIPPLVQ